MRIKFGYGLDGSKPKRIQTQLGEVEVGPVGFLSLLETQCGLARPIASETTRILQFMACLKALDNEERFYHRSFSVDQFNVAKTLLQWRDSWYEAGWEGAVVGSVSARIQDMASVEKQAQDSVSPGFGQRMQTVLQVLSQQKTQIEQVSLLNPLEDFSPLWQAILQQFEVTEQSVVTASGSLFGNDLCIVQQTLAMLAQEQMPTNPHGSIQKQCLRGDESFVIVKARSKAVSARLISQWLVSQGQQNPDSTVAILCGSEGAEMDTALAAVDLPRLGFEKASPWRPLLQVLPIALELLWEPLNPQVLLQFLMHPLGLLPGRIRYPLAQVVADTPGIGGEQWQKTLSRVLDKEKAREDHSAERLKQLHHDLEYWFASERYTPEAGLPIDVAKQRTLKIAQWLAQQQSRREDEAMRALFGAAYSQATELNTALSTLMVDGTTHIKPEQLRYLLEQLTGAGTGIVDQFAECIPDQPQWLAGATHPDSFNQAVDTVIWWDLQAPPSQATYPWSQQELNQLSDQGVILPDPDQQLQRQALSWLKPVNAARKRLMMVLHDSEEGHHRLWDQICSCLENWQEITVEDSVLNAHAIIAFNNLETVQVENKPLAPVRRWWQLESGAALGKREQESYSSLEHFFYSPYQWVLRYQAKLKVGTLQSLSDGNVLKGTLVHRLYERFFNDNTAVLTSHQYADAEVNQWFDQAMTELLTEEGAVLLQPGRLVEKEQFIANARLSLHELIRQLRAAKVTVVAMEQAQETMFFGGHLSGYIDMKVINAEGNEAVIDIKWGGVKYRKASLKDNKHLQLVTYSYMRHQISETKQWPAVAFFIIDGGGAMLAQNTHYFPEAIEVKPGTEENHAVIWQKMKKTWEWRRDQIDQGLIEVTVTGTEADEHSDPGEDALSIAETSDRFNDYKVLTGWGE